MQFDRDALGGGLTVFTTVRNGKAEIEFTAYLIMKEKKGDTPCAHENLMVEIEMSDREGREVAVICLAAQEICTGTSLIIYPHLWQSVEDPYLYHVTVCLLREDDILDKLETKLPVCTFGKLPLQGFCLNEKPFSIKAVGYEIPSQMYGKERYCEEIRRDMEAVLELGANTVCLLHPSKDYYFYEICQEMGILVWQEAEGDVPQLIGERENGLLTLDRQRKKDLYYLYKARWSKQPFVHICGRLNYCRGGETTVVQVYSNQKKVALYVNGVLFEFKECQPCFVFEDVPLSGTTIISAQAGECFSSLTLQKSLTLS